jgi:hypothetical protein
MPRIVEINIVKCNLDSVDVSIPRNQPFSGEIDADIAADLAWHGGRYMP